jgi:hypothetical protein
MIPLGQAILMSRRKMLKMLKCPFSGLQAVMMVLQGAPCNSPFLGDSANGSASLELQKSLVKLFLSIVGHFEDGRHCLPSCDLAYWSWDDRDRDDMA